MTPVSAAPQPMPAQAGPSPGAADPAAAADGTVDFAGVLQAQIDQPAKAASGAEILAALPAATGTDSVGEGRPADAQPAAPDLSVLLPALAALLPQVPAPAAVGPIPPSGTSGGMPSLDAASGGPATAQNPFLAVPSGADSAKESQAAAPSAPIAVQPDPTARPDPAARSDPASGAGHAPFEAAEAARALPQEAQTLPAAAAAPADATAVAHAAAAPAHAAPTAEAPSVVRVDTPVGGRGWDAEVGQKIVLMANRQESRAELTLTPPHLGRVEVSITLNGDQTSAAFVSASPAAREALEQALPRLREILAESGITLGQDRKSVV